MTGHDLPYVEKKNMFVLSRNKILWQHKMDPQEYPANSNCDCVKILCNISVGLVER